MEDELELIADGDGLSVVGKPSAVDRFLGDTGLLKFSRELPLGKLGGVLNAGSNLAQAGSEVAANSGRWLKITPESAEVIRKFGLTPPKTPAISHAMAGKAGDIKSWLQIETRAGSLLTNPAVLAGAVGLMAQLARQHEMNEIKGYLQRIDEKVDDVLRATKDAELAKAIGAGLDIQSALGVRDRTGMPR